MDFDSVGAAPRGRPPRVAAHCVWWHMMRVRQMRGTQCRGSRHNSMRWFRFVLIFIMFCVGGHVVCRAATWGRPLRMVAHDVRSSNAWDPMPRFTSRFHTVGIVPWYGGRPHGAARTGCMLNGWYRNTAWWATWYGGRQRGAAHYVWSRMMCVRKMRATHCHVSQHDSM